MQYLDFLLMQSSAAAFSLFCDDSLARSGVFLALLRVGYCELIALLRVGCGANLTPT